MTTALRPGALRVLRTALAEICQSVTSIAPAYDMSGQSRAITWQVPVRVRQLEPGAHAVFECAGTPADSVRVGVLTDLLDGAPVDLVISRINHGSNLGDDVAYSGTMAAGLEAATLGVPALCFSRQPAGAGFAVADSEADQGAPSPDFTAQARLAARIVRSLSPAPPGGAVVLNVNFSYVLRDDRLELTRLGRHWYPRAGIARRAGSGSGNEYFLFGDPNVPGVRHMRPSGARTSPQRRGALPRLPPGGGLGRSRAPGRG
jgi:5'-nucleotidase